MAMALVMNAWLHDLVVAAGILDQDPNFSLFLETDACRTAT
jgi:hypothetical protein